MFSIKKLVRREKGASLAIALIFLAIGAIMIPPLLLLIGSGLEQGEAIENRTDTLYSSDAGVEWVINILKTGGEGVTDSYGLAGLPNAESTSRTYNLSGLNGSAVKVKLIYHDAHDAGSYYEVVSTATLNGKSMTTNAALRYQPSGGSVFDNAITALDGNIILNNNAAVLNGNIIANGNITLENNASVDGDALVSTTHYISDIRNGIEGTKTINGTLTFTSIDTEIYKTEAQIAKNGTTSSTINLSNNATSTRNGPLHVLGNIILSNNSKLTINGALYIEGYVSLGNNSELIVNGPMYVNKYLYADNNSTMQFGGTTYINGTLTLGNNNSSNNQHVIVAKNDITINNNSTFNLQTAPLIISEQGDIDIRNNAKIGGYLYAPNGNITLENNTSLTGAAAALNITMANNATIDYNVNGLNDLPGGGGTSATLEILAWEYNTRE
ncbi:DUF7305 domain-containing protein [Dehalococcoides mccartyi]|uniref:DUF7305 domain-containing protein n=1 Tax=Dehalococcoides mccartyi TaxID=61435 RepID=UPI003392DEE6